MAVLSKFKCGITKENNFTHSCESTSLSRDKVSRSKVLGSSSLDIDKSICSGGRTGVPDICKLARVPKPSDIN